MRAVEPRESGTVDNGGVRVAYEVFGNGPRTVVFTAPDPITHSRVWKGQVPFMAGLARVVTIDPRGNGNSDRPLDQASYTDEMMYADTVAIIDHLGVDRAVLVGLCSSVWPALMLAARHPDRIAGVVGIGTFAPFLAPALPHKRQLDWTGEPPPEPVGWATYNRHHWRHGYADFVRFFFDQLFPEPHSTKQYEDAVRWAQEASVDALIAANDVGALCVIDRAGTEAVLAGVRCPVLTIHGDDDRCQPVARSEMVAELTGGRHVTLSGAGHLPMARHPVVVNHLLRDFLDQVWPRPVPPRQWRMAAKRPPRALMLSSPIGLGHARRDLAVARALRDLRPDIEIDWLTQHPVTEMVDRAGERVLPASKRLANESAHIESECGEHDLHAFQAIRDMDEVLVNNFMVFDDVVAAERYDLVIGDEAWDVDHFLHENPELKRSALAWLTDFVGWLPFADGGAREATLTRDYNAEMLEHIARSPRIRDRSLFVGDAEDVVPDSLGAGLPTIRDWTENHFEFSGYITGFDPIPAGDLAGVREELGYEDGEQVCVVTVGGSGVGLPLLKRVVETFPEARRLVPGLRMVVVCGPRIDPARIPGAVGREGLSVLPYVHDLWRHLAVCDLAVVQGGLTTTMELVAAQRPFVYVPLRHHFEQQFHVSYRLARHRAGHRLDYDDVTPETLAPLIAKEIGQPVDYVPIRPGAAQRLAARVAELI
jgi:pimeloyl-ACP methyl ester carboxylesterase